MSGSLGLKMGNAEQSSYFPGDMKGGRFYQSLLLQCGAVAFVPWGSFMRASQFRFKGERETPHKVNASGRLGIGGQQHMTSEGG